MSGGLNSLISVAAVPAAKEESSSEEESSEEEEEVAAPAVVAAPGNYIYLCYIWSACKLKRKLVFSRKFFALLRI